jgi:hypothetical protein
MAAVMFLAIGGMALYIAFTGQSTYLPEWLAAWNRWATGVAGDLAAGLRGVPAVAQGAALAGLASAVGWAVYRAWRADGRPESRHEPALPSKEAAS